LESLRASRPAWTQDGSSFAFVSFIPGDNKDHTGLFNLRTGTVANQQIEELAQGKESFRDLRWAPGGKRLGIVRGDVEPSLHILRPGEKRSLGLHFSRAHRFGQFSLLVISAGA
jgi:hypothetical protein